MTELIIKIEPSKTLSSLCGFPYFIEKVLSIDGALEQGLINDKELEQMREGEEICKRLKVNV